MMSLDAASSSAAVSNPSVRVTTIALSSSSGSTTSTTTRAFAMTSASSTATSSTIRGRKRTASSRLPAKLKEPAAVARRNARERRRVKMVNDGFMRLRKHVPTDPKNKKLSKVKTLRLAIDYIKHLQQILTENAAKPTQLLPAYTLPNIGDDLDGVAAAWLQDGLARSHRELDEEIFQTINPARLRKSY